MPQGAIPLAQQAYQGQYSALNLSGSAAVVVNAKPGRVMQINVNVASTAAVTVYDASTTAGATTANIVYASSTAAAAGTVVVLDFPVLNGIVINPGYGTVAVSYD